LSAAHHKQAFLDQHITRVNEEEQEQEEAEDCLA
jgi:hypothetical protein